MKTEKVSWREIWVGDARNTHKWFIKNYYWNLKLSIVALLNVIKCFPHKWKNNPLKDASHPKNNNKNSSHSKRNNIEKGENGKKNKKSLNIATTIKFFTFVFCIQTRTYLAKK